MKKTGFLLVLLLFVCLADAQTAFINKNYKRVKKKDLNLFITPYFSSGAKTFNDIFFTAFNKEPYSVVDTAQSAYNILNLSTFNNSMRKVTAITYDAGYFKKNNNLYATLAQDAILDFRKNCLNADLIIISNKIVQKQILNVNGSQRNITTCDIAVYDLSTGEFIALFSNKIKKTYHSKSETNIAVPLDELIDGLYRSFNEWNLRE